MQAQPVQLHMLAPAAVLVFWSLVMLAWLARARFAAMAGLGRDLSKAPPGGRGQNLEGIMPDRVMWKSHNYTHLMEQPTLFYAVVLILTVAGPAPTDIALAWAYTSLRVIHSLWQATVNTIPVRLTLFMLSSACLASLAVRALILTL